MKKLLTRFVYWIYHTSNNTLSSVLDQLDPMTDEQRERWERQRGDFQSPSNRQEP